MSKEFVHVHQTSNLNRLWSMAMGLLLLLYMVNKKIYVPSRYIPYVPASLGPVRRSIWGGYWPGIFLKLSPPEFLCLASLNLKFGAKIPKTVDFFLMPNFWWSILAGSKIDAIPTFTTCSLPNIYSFKALPLAAYFYSLCRELRVFCLVWSKSGEMIIVIR